MPLSTGELVFNLNYAWLAEVQLRPETPSLASVTQAAYGLLDGRVSWRIDDKGLDLRCWART